MSDDDSNRAPDVQVSDPEDYNRTQRFREIHTARQRVAEFVAEMEWTNDGTGWYKQHARQLSALVALYIYELSPLIERSDIDPDKYLSDTADRHGGLLAFATMMGGSVSTEKDRKRPVSPMTSMTYFDAANRFYAEIGMDLELEEDDGDAGFEYEDLLDEGPPGTGEAPDIEAAGDD